MNRPSTAMTCPVHNSAEVMLESQRISAFDQKRKLSLSINIMSLGMLLLVALLISSVLPICVLQ